MVSLIRRNHATYIVLTAFLSTVSLVIVCTSFATQYWIRAYANQIIEDPLFSNINYGLFKGTLVRRVVPSPSVFDIYFTCVWAENSCAWSCIDTEDGRKNEVEQLIKRERPRFGCISTERAASIIGTPKLKSTSGEILFTNGGLWLSTIIFIVILIIALIVSIVLSIINCAKSPIETYFNVHGIYLTNGIALTANFLVLVIYGICYAMYIKKNVAIYDTIVGDYASNAELAYSYWILIIPLIFEVVGIFLIAMREKIVNSDRAETKIDVATDIPETGVLF